MPQPQIDQPSHTNTVDGSFVNDIIGIMSDTVEEIIAAMDLS